MSNIFQEVLTDVEGVQDKLLGPTYPYYKNIKNPSQIGMSSNGTLQQTAQDINGLIQYVELLVTGNSQASATGGPLGNKFFLLLLINVLIQMTRQLVKVLIDIFMLIMFHKEIYHLYQVV
jgi:hypothetical protein